MMNDTAVRQLIAIQKTLHNWNDKYNNGEKIIMTVNGGYASAYNATSCKVVPDGESPRKYAHEHGVDIVIFDRNYEEAKNIC